MVVTTMQSILADRGRILGKEKATSDRSGISVCIGTHCVHLLLIFNGLSSEELLRDDSDNPNVNPCGLELWQYGNYIDSGARALNQHRAGARVLIIVITDEISSLGSCSYFSVGKG